MHTYYVAEIGQNHNGSLNLAKKLVDVAAMPIMDHAFSRELPGVDAVKLQARDLEYELADSERRRPYDSPHSFGRTYGEHREALELSVEEHEEVYHYATERGLDLVETLCAPSCVDRILKRFTPARLKVASRDLTNHPLLDVLASTGLPMIVSTGMADHADLDAALEVVTKHHEHVSILHCISQYPADYETLNLRAVPWLAERYPYPVGYSDHSIGIVAPAVAVALGAQLIEKHITLSHTLKGSDHACALEPDGLWRSVRDVRNMEAALGDPTMEKPESVEAARAKLERSVATKRPIPAGTQVTEADLALLSPGTGLRWSERERIVGTWTVNDLPAHELITATMVSS